MSSAARKKPAVAPDRAEVWFARNEQAEALEEEGRYEEALALYRQNVAEGCSMTFPFERMAVLYTRMERPDLAEEALRRAVEAEARWGPSEKRVRLESRLEGTTAARQRSAGRRSRPVASRRAVEFVGTPAAPAPARREAAWKGWTVAALAAFLLVLLYALA